MKKSLALSVVSVVALASISGAYALTRPEPVKPVVHTAQVVKQTEPVATPTVEPTAEPAPQPVAETPTAEEPDNPTKFKTLIEQTATARGFDVNGVWRQWYCLDKAITGSVGYSDYNAVLAYPWVDRFLNPHPNQDGVPVYLQFGTPAPGVCGQSIKFVSAY